MTEGFVKFPRTPHLLWLGETTPRGDKLMSAAEAKDLLRQPASIEEKVDGANLGLSLGPNGRLRAQSRGHCLEEGASGQWKPLWRWLALREAELREALRPSLVLFGEWCYAEHSVQYDALPDWLLVFDVYDRVDGRFWSRDRRDVLARQAGLSVVPLLDQGVFSQDSLVERISRSRLANAPAEGIYVRWDEGGWLEARAKVVRPGWVMASDDHWSARPLRTNRLAEECEATYSGGIPSERPA